MIFHIKTTSPKIRENDLERLSKDVTISQIVEEIKRNSSRWIKNLDPVYYHFFAWQVVMLPIPSVNQLWIKHYNILPIRKSITQSFRLQKNIERS